ncbi:unnamed protein product [Triticum turgidum subsp. durum]|uniref:F-box domain-containing protein n=1 Tax=Triticum turgidum subsp. durum TaxID=4567 RepID=A0A9R1RHZ8_TRITD|nr:unnamed protein product [Triticum turgidum subsp. durum]
MALPEIPDELLVEILLRFPTAADLIRASAACVSFRRLIADRSFPRRFRKLHPPPLLGFLDPERHRFHPAVPPHPSAPAARAVASAADFSFGFLPSPSRRWFVREVRDGRVLLDRPRRLYAGEVFGPLFKEMAVCDPLHRQYLLLPRIPDDLAASVVGAQGSCYADSFLVPSGYDDEEEAAATEEPSFRVIWMVLLQNKPVIAVFSSGTGQWRTVPSPTWSEMSPGFVLSTLFIFMRRHYAHGCFYWISGSTEKLLVLDIRRMELSVADHPPCERNPADDVTILEAGQGTTLLFVLKRSTSPVTYTVWRNNGGSSTQWQMDKTFSLDSGSLLTGAVGRHLLLYHGGSSVKRGCSTQDVDTFQLDRVCATFPKPSHAYCNLPPSLLSSPTVSSGTPQGAGDTVPVPEAGEAGPGGVQRPVLSSAAQALNPLLDNNGAEAGRGGARRRRWGWGWGWACGVCRGRVAELRGDEGPE